jgi:putative serine protease PepD
VSTSPQGTGGRPFAQWLIAIVALLVAGAVGGLIAHALDDSDGGDSATSASAGPCQVTRITDERLGSVVTILVGTRGVGSGEVIRSDGYVLTNDHVIAPAGSGGEIRVRFADGQTERASVTGRDPRSDLAVVHVSRTGLETIPIGDSAALRVGQPVVALGAPLGLSSTVTSGIVSALGRTVRLPGAEGTTALVADGIQTDAAINPGNSGGALVDCAGDLVGVPTAGASVPTPQGQSSAGSIGLGFAIPVNLAARISDELIATGSVTHAYLGLEAQPVSSASGKRGLVLTGVTPSGPGALAGLREGDVIVSINGKPAAGADQLAVLTLTKRAGEHVEIGFDRSGTRATATVTLAAAP